MFTLRVAGNVVNDDILGSMEYATKIIGVPLILVLAHTSCGAVEAACKDVKLGHITDIVDKIQPSVKPAMQETGMKDCNKPELVNAIAIQNARKVAQNILDKSPIIKKLVDSKELGIVEGIQDIKTGKITFFDEERLK